MIDEEDLEVRDPKSDDVAILDVKAMKLSKNKRCRPGNGGPWDVCVCPCCPPQAILCFGFGKPL